MKSEMGIWASVKAGTMTLETAMAKIAKVLRYQETKTYRRLNRLVKQEIGGDGGSTPPMGGHLVGWH